MAENPFEAPSSNRPNFGSGMTRGDLLRWCDDQNQLPMSKLNGWWYYVMRDRDSGVISVQKLEGINGEEVQKFARGWRPDYQNWDKTRLADLERKLSWFLKQGTAPAQQEFAA